MSVVLIFYSVPHSCKGNYGLESTLS